MLENLNIERSTERIKETGEVFTPTPLVIAILNKIPVEIWTDPSKTFIDPSCGDGQFLVQVKSRLLTAGHTEGHIIENMIYGIDLMSDNVEYCVQRLGADLYDHNIVCFNTMEWDGISWPPRKRVIATLDDFF